MTERCNDHATRPRHASTAAAKAARIAPTQMKTVPSGRSDFCIKGAAAVSGTFWFGIPTPASVGRPERAKPPPGRDTVGKTSLEVGLPVAELCGAAVDCAEDGGMLMRPADDAGADVCGAALDSPWPSGAERLDRFGKFVTCASAGVMASSRLTRPTEGRMASVVNESRDARSRGELGVRLR